MKMIILAKRGYKAELHLLQRWTLLLQYLDCPNKPYGDLPMVKIA